MSVEDLQQAVERFRGLELRRAVRGVDPEQARDLLDEAAELLATAGREQNELRRELERSGAPTDESAIAKAFVNATRAAEQIEAEAHEQAAKIVAAAEAQSATLLEEVTAQAQKREQEAASARKQFEQELAATRTAHEKELEAARDGANAALANAREELERLEKHADEVRSLVADLERRIVEIAEGALAELAAFDASKDSGDEADLLSDLRPPAAPSDVKAD
jgi:archaellum component FlaC